MTLPVSTHQEVFKHLKPLQAALYSSLVEDIQAPGDAMYMEHEAFVGELESCAKELFEAVQNLGASLAGAINPMIFAAAKRVCKSGMGLAEFQSHAVVVGESDAVEQALWNMVESLQRQVLQWLDKYQKVVENPEKFQSDDISLVLELNLEKEFVVLQKLMKKSEKHGVLWLAAAATLGFWLGGE